MRIEWMVTRARVFQPGTTYRFLRRNLSRQSWIFVMNKINKTYKPKRTVCPCFHVAQGDNITPSPEIVRWSCQTFGGLASFSLIGAPISYCFERLGLWVEEERCRAADWQVAANILDWQASIPTSIFNVDACFHYPTSTPDFLSPDPLISVQS